MPKQNRLVDEIIKGKKALAASRRLMETGIVPEKSPIMPKPKQDTLDMSQEAMKKRDEEYRRRGWIK